MSDKELELEYLNQSANEAAELLTKNGTSTGPCPASLIFLVARTAAFDNIDILSFSKICKEMIIKGFEQGKKMMNETIEQQN